MNYKIIKMTSRNNVVKYRFEIFIDFGEHTEVIAPHFGFLTEQKAIAEAQKEIRRQGIIMIGDYAMGVDWNLEGNDFKITLTDMYSSSVLDRIKYFEINKLFGIG